jgi:predicted outer membrane repeat protein
MLLLLLQADSDGGALQLFMLQALRSPNYTLAAADCTFFNNTSSGGLGGAIAVDGQGIKLTSVSFDNNTVSGSSSCWRWWRFVSTRLTCACNHTESCSACTRDMGFRIWVLL